MAKRRKRLTNREFWEKHGPRMEDTDRKLLARIAELEKQIAEEKSSRENADAA
jgi:hypothetical protein